MKRLFFLFIVTGIVFGFLGHSFASQELPMLTVGHVGHDHQIALYVAADAGEKLAEEYGVYLKKLKDQEVYDLYENGTAVARLRLVRVGGGSKMPAALEQGHIEVGLGGLGPTVKFIDRGAPLKVLMPLNNDGDALIVKKGMKVDSWKSFVEYIKNSPQPVKIGYKAPMAVAYMILARALEEEGIPYGPERVSKDGRPVKVITVNLQGLKNALPSLEASVVDAVVVNEPMASILVHKGVGKKVADLAELPPEGKWQGHPCCVVAARRDALEKKRGIIKSLLKAISAGTDLMKKNIEMAFSAEARWTKTPPAVGRDSVSNVAYVSRPDENWLRGFDTWVNLMQTSGHFKKHLKGKNTDDIRKEVLDLEIMHEIMTEAKVR